MEDNGERPDAVASATAPALPSLEADNCIRPHRRKARFLAQENIRLYIENAGQNNVGVLTTTAADVLEAREFQRKWHSFRTNVLKEMFDTGMWVRERQPRSGNWHSHSVVDVGFDIKSNFPFDEVAKRLYANVDRRLRDMWKQLRTGGEKCGLGRIELLPIKSNGSGCAVYLTKYLGKALVSDKADGEERCRLFGVWGGRRFVYSGFDWVSNRIMRKRKAWLARVSYARNEEEFAAIFGPRWWQYLGKALMEVMMPREYYQILVDGELRFDELGWRRYTEDYNRFKEIEQDEEMAIRRSHFSLHYAHGMMLFNDSGQAMQHAANRMDSLDEDGLSLGPRRLSELKTEIERRQKHVNP